MNHTPFSYSYLSLLIFLGLALMSCIPNEKGQQGMTTAMETELTETAQAILPEQLQVIDLDTLKYCIKDDKVGAGGYDLVNYFLVNKAEKGLESISTVYQGVEYRFIDEENKKTFSKNPDKYLPAYGGWCAMTLSMGRATTPVYDNFLIANGKLYLFERTLSVNGRTLWLQDPDLNAERARKHYEDYKEDGVIEVN